MPRGLKVNIDEYLTNIQPYLEVGCSLYEACLHAIVPYTTVVDYQKNDDAIRKKIERMQNVHILKARESVVHGMIYSPKLALKYLERKKKDEFSLKTENSQKVEGTIQFTWAHDNNDTIQTEETSYTGS